MIATQVYLPELGGILIDKASMSPTLDLMLPGCAATSQPEGMTNAE